MNVFKQIESIYNNTKEIADELSDHLNSDFEHYNAKLIHIADLSAVEDDLHSLMIDAKKRLDNCPTQTSLETAIKNYLYFVSENHDFVKDRVSEDDLTILEALPSLQSFNEFSKTADSLNVMSNNDLNEFFEQISKESLYVSTSLIENKTPDLLTGTCNYELLSSMVTTKLDMNFLESKTSDKLSLEEVDKLLQEWPVENFSSHSSNEIEDGSRYDLMSPARTLNVKDDNRESTTHSILKSSSCFISHRQQNITPRVKFVLDESSDSETPVHKRESKILIKDEKENSRNFCLKKSFRN